MSAVSRHETFFSCVQAACYILCFYGVEIANIQKNSKNMQKKWQTVLTCTLHPLRFCLQSVRVEFIRLAQHSNMLEESCWDAMPGDVLPNSRGDDSTIKKNNVNMGAGFNPLDSFFPYDPCLLRMLYQPIEKYYRSWKGVPGLDDIVDIEIEVEAGCTTESAASVSVEHINEDDHHNSTEARKDEGRHTRSRESSICSDSGSEYSQSMSSSVTPFGASNDSGIRSPTQPHSMNVSMSVSMTESVGMGLLEERDEEKRERGEKGSERGRERYLDSRAQSMVSDCSLEDDPNSLSVPRGGHFYSHTQSQSLSSSTSGDPPLISYAQFGVMVGRTESAIGVGMSGVDGTGVMGMLDSRDRNWEQRNVLGGNENDNCNGGNMCSRLSMDNITQLPDKTGWAKPDRRPRQYSVGSTGSW